MPWLHSTWTQMLPLEIAEQPGSPKSIIQTGTIALNLATAINQNSNLQTIGVNANSTGTSLKIRSVSNNITTYTKSTSAGATETMQFTFTRNGVSDVVVSGIKTTGDSITLTVKDPALSGGQQSVSYTVLSTDTLITIAAGLKNAVNSNSALSLSSSSTNVTNYSVSTSTNATETDSASTIGWVTAQLVQAITGDADLKALEIKARNVSNAYFENSIKFRGDAENAPSANTVEFNQQLSTPAPILDTGMQTNFTYDANGNMTSDGTNSYQWDAENRLIKITYPGADNYTRFSYDGISRNVATTEYQGNALTD